MVDPVDIRAIRAQATLLDAIKLCIATSGLPAKTVYLRRVNKQLRGSRHPNALLNEQQVAEIAAKHAAGATQRALAIEYGVCFATINHIFSGRLWAHLGFAKTGAS